MHEQTIRFWWAPPDRLREEVDSNVPHQTRTVVIDGELWWLSGRELDPVSNELLDGEERANHTVGGGEHFRPLLDPSWLLAAVELDEIAPGDGVLHVRARLRDDLDGPYLHHLHLVGGADDYALEVDAELGYLRAVTAWLDGEELSHTRVDELALGESLPDERFARPEGVAFEAPGGHARHVSLEEAAAEAPFTLFYLPELPEGAWRLDVRTSRRPHPSVWLLYHRSDGRGAISIGQSGEDTGAYDGEQMLAFERDGTHVVLQSDSLRLDALRELGDRLEPVRA